jgi:hypothetical protein
VDTLTENMSVTQRLGRRKRCIPSVRMLALQPRHLDAVNVGESISDAVAVGTMKAGGRVGVVSKPEHLPPTGPGVSRLVQEKLGELRHRPIRSFNTCTRT